jgi:hypothetical protein
MYICLDGLLSASLIFFFSPLSNQLKTAKDKKKRERKETFFLFSYWVPRLLWHFSFFFFFFGRKEKK